MPMTNEQRSWVQRVLGVSAQGDPAQGDPAQDDTAQDDTAQTTAAQGDPAQGDAGDRAAPDAFDPTAGGAFAQASQAWRSTRTQISGDLDKLHGAFAAAFKDHGNGPEIEKAFRARVDALLDTMDETLSHKLDEVQKATDPALHAKLVQEARAILLRHQAQVAGDAAIAALDANPFMPLQIAKTLNQTFSSFSLW